MITNIRAWAECWRGDDVIRVRWEHNGTQKSTVLFAKNGKHYHVPRPPSMSSERLAIVQSLWPDVRSVRQAEEKLLVEDNRRAVEKAEEAMKR